MALLRQNYVFEVINKLKVTAQWSCTECP